MKVGLRSVAALLSTALAVTLLVACAPDGPSDSARVIAGSDTHVVREDGLEIQIPGAAISGSGTLSTKTVEDDGLTGWSITLDGDAKLTGEAVITFPGTVDGGEPMPVLVYNEKLGEPFTYGGDPVKVEGGYAVTTTHFSNWFQLDWGDTLAKAADLVKRKFGQTPDAEVACEGAEEAEAEDYSLMVTGSESYTWCLGMEDATPIVKVGNPNPYAIRVEATPGLALTDPDETLVSLVPQLFSVLADAPTKAGNTVYLLGAGASYTFRWATLSQQQGLQVMPSAAGYTASALLFAVDTVQLVLKEGTAASILEAISNTASCTTGFAEMVKVDVQDGGDAADYLGGAIDTMTACLGKVIEKAYGLEGIAAVALIAGVSWLFSGVALAFTAVAAIANARPATGILDGPGVIKTAPTIEKGSFCRQLYDRPIAHSVTETVGYAWTDVRWRERTEGIGVPWNPENWVKCEIEAGGFAPPYTIDTLTEFWPDAADARDLYGEYEPGDSDDVTSVKLDLGDGEGWLTMYDGEGHYNSSAWGYALRDNVWVSFEIQVGLVIGRRLGWPDQATLVTLATEVMNQALTGYGAPAE